MHSERKSERYESSAADLNYINGPVGAWEPPDQQTMEARNATARLHEALHSFTTGPWTWILGCKDYSKAVIGLFVVKLLLEQQCS